MQRVLPESLDAAREVEVTGMSEKETDMKNHMLLLSGAEPFETVSDGLDGVYDGTDTVILHDSFYNATRERLSKLFPNGKMINFQHLKERSDEVTKGTRLIVNSVERAFFGRFEGKWLGRKGEVSSAILARNTKAAGECAFQSVPAPAAGGSQPMTVSVPPSASGFSSCLRLKLEGWQEGDLNVLLPMRQGTSSVFSRS